MLRDLEGVGEYLRRLCLNAGAFRFPRPCNIYDRRVLPDLVHQLDQQLGHPMRRQEISDVLLKVVHAVRLLMLLAELDGLKRPALRLSPRKDQRRIRIDDILPRPLPVIVSRHLLHGGVFRIQRPHLRAPSLRNPAAIGDLRRHSRRQRRLVDPGLPAGHNLELHFVHMAQLYQSCAPNRQKAAAVALCAQPS